MATSKAFRKVGPKVVPPLDRTLHKLTGGRVIVSRLMVPCMVLTTTGRKSGLPRESPLACVPDGDGGWWVVGSNFGQETHPAWTGNLIADPNATVSYEHTRRRSSPHLLDRRGEGRGVAQAHRRLARLRRLRARAAVATSACSTSRPPDRDRASRRGSAGLRAPDGGGGLR